MFFIQKILPIIFLFAFTTPSFAQDSVSKAVSKTVPKTINGVWLTENKKAFVEIDKCTDNPQQICGKIVKLTTPLDKDGKEKVDKNNKNPQLRTRKLLGLPVLQHFQATDDANIWDNGTIYNGEDGDTYDSKIALQPDDTLLVKGCVWIICKSQHWTRQ